MARHLGSRNKRSRRAGVDLNLSTNSSKLQRRLAIPPGQHGHKRMRRRSGFGEQLSEKQKLKWMFGIFERQFRRYFTQAAKSKGETGKVLLQLLERRLDNVIYRLNFAPTRAAARQLVSHGHVLVNTKKVTIPSYQVRPEDLVTLKAKALELPQTVKLLSQKDTQIPLWLKRQAAVGKMTRLPERTEMVPDVNEQMVVEYYSR